MFVLLARDELGLGSFEFGVLLVAPGVGGLVGAALASRLHRRSLRVVLALAVATNALTSLAIGVTSSPALVGALLGKWLHHRVPERGFYEIVHALLFAVGVKLIWDGVAGMIM